nr:DUF418 domain-containing protein [Sphingomonas jejuensis]
MAIHKAGLLSHPQAARWGTIAAAVGLPATLILAWICWHRGFDPVDTAAVVFAWSIAPRVLLTLAWLFLLAGWAARALDPVSARVRAAGRMALSNYLGATLVFTALFDGWGLGLYGLLGRPVLLLLVLVAWTVMLWWSPAWLSRFRLGPIEWLWRSMAAMQLLPLTRK